MPMTDTTLTASRQEESRLIARVLEGHFEDYGYFMEHYGRQVFVLVSRMVPCLEDAEELTQDAFMRAYERLDGFDQRSSFSTWVCRIAYRLTISWLRKQKAHYLNIDDQPWLSAEEVDETLDNEERFSELQTAISLLRPEEQALVTLFYYEDYSISDIAYVFELEPAAVKARLHRVRRKLYLIMNKNSHAER